MSNPIPDEDPKVTAAFAELQRAQARAEKAQGRIKVWHIVLIFALLALTTFILRALV